MRNAIKNTSYARCKLCSMQILQGIFDALFNGLSIGSVLLMAALGLAIVFGLMGVINMAHGELMMLGAYTTFVVQNVFKPLGEPVYSLYIFVALVMSFLVAAAVGVVLERGVIRLLYGRPLETLLATWGVSLILRQFVRSISGSLALGLVIFAVLFWGGWVVLARQRGQVPGAWEQVKTKALSVLGLLSGAIAWGLGSLANGQPAWAKPWFSARNIDVTAPGWLRGGMAVGGVQFPFTRLFIIVLTAVCLAGMYWFLNRSIWGLRIRAVTQNRNMSACLGIPTDRVDALTFALGSGLAGVAGCAVSLLGSVGPNLGINYIVDAFMVVVVGGVGKLVGSIVAALAIGTLNYLVGSGVLGVMLTNINATAFKPLIEVVTFFATTSMAKVLVFVVIIVFLQVRPAGLFPQKGRTVDV
jgi:urea transport system permease protein